MIWEDARGVWWRETDGGCLEYSTWTIWVSPNRTTTWEQVEETRGPLWRVPDPVEVFPEEAA